MPFSLTPRLWQVRLFAVTLLASLGTALFAQSNQPSPANGFDPNANGAVNVALVQRDGKVLLGGAFTTLRPNGSLDNVDRNSVARVNSDGTLDLDFNPNANGQIFAMAVQSTGKIIVGGAFTNVGGLTRNRIARLNVDGTVDSTFNIDLGGGLAPEVYALLVLPDDRIVVGGAFTTANGATRNRLARFSSNGVLDTAFDPNPNAAVLSLARQTSGKLLVGGSFTSLQPAGTGTVTTRRYLARINLDGTPDSEFDPKPDNSVHSIVVQADGSFVIGGNFNTVQPVGSDSVVTRSRIARFSESGALDTAYTPNANGQVSSMVLQPDGRLLIAGNFTSLIPNGGVAVTRTFVARINVDGTIDPNFQVQLNAAVNAVAVQGDGRIVIGGIFTQMRVSSATVAVNRNRVARLNGDGTPDTTLDPAASGLILAQAVQSNGQIVVGGSFTIMGGLTRNYLARLNADGTVDTAFKPAVNAPISTIAIQPADQSILIGGSFTNVDGVVRTYFARLKSDGTLDAGFNPVLNNTVSAIAVQTDGKIILSGAFLAITPSGGEFVTRNHFVRLTSTGGLDTDFNPNADQSANVITVLGDGKILVGGDFNGFAPNNGTSVFRPFSARLNSNGTVDTTYDPQPNGPVRDQVVQDDGKIVIAGDFVTVAPKGGPRVIRYYIARFNADSTLDTGYNPRASTTINALALQKSDGKIIAGGQFAFFRPGDDPAKTVDRSRIARINADGSIDPTYDPNAGGQVRSLAVLASGKVLASGGFTSLKPAGKDLVLAPYRIVRLNSDGTVDSAFDPAATTRNGGSVEVIALQPDSKLIVAGSFDSSAAFGGSRSSNLSRFTASGDADLSFLPNANGTVSSVLVQPARTTVPQANVFAWFNFNSTLRSSFSTAAVSQLVGQVSVILPLADGKIILGGSFTTKNGTNANLVRLNADGTFDPSFNPQPAGAVNAVVQQKDGKLIIGGSFDSVNTVPRYRLARLNTDGSVDSGYNPYPGDAVYALALQSDDKLIVGGAFTTFQPNGATATTARNYLARLNTDGTLDTAYNPLPSSPVRALRFQPDEQLLVGGDFTSFQPNNAATVTTRNYIARLKSNGDLDTAFDPEANGAVYAIALQPSDNKPIIGGAFTLLQPPTSGGFSRASLARLNVDGTVDSNFDPSPNGTVRTISVTSDGFILVGGTFTTLQPGAKFDPVGRSHLALLNSDGAINPNFNPGPAGDVFASAALPDNSFLVGGSFTSLAANANLVVGGSFSAIGGSVLSNLALLDGDGSANPTFAPNPNGPVAAIVQQTDTKLVVAGGFTSIGGLPRNRLARLTTEGAVDSTFNPNIEGGAVSALALQGDGKLIVGGAFTSVGGAARARLARVNTDGSVDAGFAATTDAQVTAVVLQPDGKIVVAGSFTTVGGLPRNRLARLNADGSLDAGFSPNVNGAVESIVLSADGKLTIGGTFTAVAGAPRNNIARLNADGSLDAAFNPGTDGSVFALALQPEGSTVLGGTFSTVAGLPRFRLARLGAGTSVTIQAISASADRTSLTWNRSGPGPELSMVRFEISPDALTWAPLAGTVTRVGNSNWRLSGLSLPADTTFSVRALGSAPTSKNTSLGLVRSEQIFNFAQTPVLAASATVAASTDKTFRYATSNGKAAVYTAAGLPAGLSIDAATGMITGTPTQTGNFAVSVMASNAGGNVSSSLTVAVGSSSGGAVAQSIRLINLSARMQVAGGGTLITGFVTTGGQVLIRAVGPGLTAFNVTDAISDPVLRIYNSAGAKVYESNDWSGSDIIAANAATGAFPLAANSKDAALLVTLDAGGYTAQVTDATGKGGSVLTEIYDANGASLTPRFVNLSTRSRVVPGAPLIGGFVISANEGGSAQRVLIRGAGPGLKQFNVTDTLENPVLKVFDTAGNLIAENDDWGTVPEAATAGVSTGAFALGAGSKDSALLLSLPPGGYTFQVTGAAGSASSGEALADIYAVP